MVLGCIKNQVIDYMHANVWKIGRMNVRNHKGSVFTDNVYLVDMYPQMADMVELCPS